LCAALAAATTWAVAAAPGDWPGKPVKLIVPAAAGSAPDVIARLVGDKLGAIWGQTVIVENKPGAGGIPGMSALAHSANDGYTLGFVPAAMGTITPLVYKNPQFNPDTELTPVGTVGTSPLVLVTQAGNGVNSLADLAKFAKAHPGKVNFAAPQPNSLPHLAGELMSKRGGMGLFTVPYPGPPAAVTAVMAGDATLTADGVPGLLPHIKSGRLKALGVTSAQRVPGLDVPPVADTYPGYDVIGWFQILAPMGTPEPVIERVNADLNKATSMPDVTARFAELGVFPRRDDVPAARAFWATQEKLMKQLVTDLGVQPQ
jgi:tripartite-type tricarboxylate transporter receptor subunit TctC